MSVKNIYLKRIIFTQYTVLVLTDIFSFLNQSFTLQSSTIDTIANKMTGTFAPKLWIFCTNTLSFEVYKFIAKGIFESSKKEHVFVHLFLILNWNLTINLYTLNDIGRFSSVIFNASCCFRVSPRCFEPLQYILILSLNFAGISMPHFR